LAFPTITLENSSPGFNTLYIRVLNFIFNLQHTCIPRCAHCSEDIVVGSTHRYKVLYSSSLTSPHSISPSVWLVFQVCDQSRKKSLHMSVKVNVKSKTIAPIQIDYVH